MSHIITKEKTISSCDDFELNIKREQKLTYKYSYPIEKKLKGIVFNIHGFGAEVAYMDNLREYIADTFDVLCVDVYYHCFFSRPENGASLEFDDIDLLILQDIISKYNMDFSDLKEITTESVLNHLNDEISRLKLIGLMEQNLKIQLPITIIPKHNEYQNFGMMQAVDHINVLYDLEKLSFNFKENYSVTLLGTSHGGYLAHLIAKFAPHKIDNVIDNSAYVKAPLNYIMGKENNINYPEYINDTYNNNRYNNITMNCFVQTYWTKNTKSNSYFNNTHYMIRDINNTQHLQYLSKLNIKKTKYISYHSLNDTLANVKDKISLYDNFQNKGFTTKLNLIKSEAEIDGKFIKNLSHGMNMSLKELANRELNNIQTNGNNIDNIEINYECEDVVYKFKYSKNKFTVEVS